MERVDDVVRAAGLSKIMHKIMLGHAVVESCPAGDRLPKPRQGMKYLMPNPCVSHAATDSLALQKLRNRGRIRAKIRLKPNRLGIDVGRF